MDLADQAGMVAFNRALACIVAEYVDSLQYQGLSRAEAVATAAVWQNAYLQMVHGLTNPRADP